VKVTHLWAKTDRTRGTDSVAGELLFYDFLRRHAQAPRSVAGGLLAELGDKPPEGPFDTRVLVIGCGRDYDPGWYEMEDLATPPFGPRAKKLPKPREPLDDGAEQAEAIPQAEYVVFEPACGGEHSSTLRRGHTLLIKHKRSKLIAEYELWVRGRFDRSSTERTRAPATDAVDDTAGGDPSDEAP
jgi:hypothetical protein